MAEHTSRASWVVVIILVLLLGGALYNLQFSRDNGVVKQKKGDRPVPVEVAPVQRGPLSLYRTFSGTIDPRAQFAVAPKVSGRIQRLFVDVSDTVVRGQTLVQMENAEFEQAVIEAEAQLAVAGANRDEAVSRFEIAKRQLERARKLNTRGIASESAFDTAQAEFLTAKSAVKAAEANLKRDEALVRAARIRLDYTEVKAEWQQGDNSRTVAERFVDEGNTVAANTPILSVVELDPVVAVIQVTEKDYPKIHLGQKAEVRADGFPGKVFVGTVTRIAPVFQESSRQAGIELEVANPEFLLKPGMFTRCTLELAHVENGVSVPEMAIIKRNDRHGVFQVSGDSDTVIWKEVRPGFQSANQVQLLDMDITGHVVTIGQRFIKDGVKIRVVARDDGQGEGLAR